MASLALVNARMSMRVLIIGDYSLYLTGFGGCPRSIRATSLGVAPLKSGFGDGLFSHLRMSAFRAAFCRSLSDSLIVTLPVRQCAGVAAKMTMVRLIP